jgi:hypothetical protein
MTIVRLTWSEVLTAAQVGIARQVVNLRDGRRDRHGLVQAPWENHIQGCIGEIAVAKFYKRRWTGNFGDFRAADVGPLQVRTTSYPQGRLILHPNDGDHEAWILTRVLLPDVVLAGWLPGFEAKQPKFWTAPGGHNRPAFFVDNAALRAMETLHI